MSDLFGALEQSEQERDEIISGRRAITAALVRTSQHHKPFIRRAQSAIELAERVALLEPTIRTTVEDACHDHTYGNVDRVMSIVLADLKNAGGHKPGCECAFCENMGKLPGTKDESDEDDGDEGEEYKDKDSDKEARTAADPQAGGGSGYQSEHLDLGANREGLEDVGSPKIDKSRVPAEGLDTIDIGSKDHPLEQQTMGELNQGEAYAYRGDGNSDGGFESDPSKRPRKTVDADTPMQPEHNVGPRTRVFPNEGQADPVTEVALAKVAGTKWSVIGIGR